MHQMHRGKTDHTWQNPPKFEPPHVTGLILPSQGLTNGRTGLQEACPLRRLRLRPPRLASPCARSKLTGVFSSASRTRCTRTIRFPGSRSSSGSGRTPARLACTWCAPGRASCVPSASTPSLSSSLPPDPPRVEAGASPHVDSPCPSPCPQDPLHGQHITRLAPNLPSPVIPDVTSPGHIADHERLNVREVTFTQQEQQRRQQAREAQAVRSPPPPLPPHRTLTLPRWAPSASHSVPTGFPSLPGTPIHR